jgi:hypothetical protein
MSRNFAKSGMIGFVFAAGMVTGFFLKSTGGGKAQIHEDALVKSAVFNSSAAPSTNQTASAKVPDISNQGEQAITLPYGALKSITRSPFVGANLIPDRSFLLRLGVGDKEAMEIKGAFAKFKTELEECELLHATLRSGKDGEYFEIAPFKLPEAHMQELSSVLQAQFGGNDWRTDLLLSSVRDERISSGSGVYRREIAIETEHDVSGQAWQMVRIRMFDTDGKVINIPAGFEVKSGKEFPRFHKLFHSKPISLPSNS